jgi:HK97 family phage major capsid protein
MDIDTHNDFQRTDLETKAGIPLDAMVTHAYMMHAFEAFKDANDQRLSKRDNDIVLEEKLARINSTIDAQARRLDEITLKSARPVFGAERAAVRSATALEHKAAFEACVRSGEAAGLRALEVKALSAGSNPDGGYLVPPEVETQIGQRLTAISPIRAIAGVRTISGNVYKKPFMTAGPAVGWVGETDARTQTGSPTLDELSFPAMELYAMPAATATLLEDAAVNIDQWLAQEVEQVFAAQEGTAFVSGDGSNKPKGFLSYTTVDNASWSWGNIGYVPRGAAGAFPASSPSDVLVDLVYAVNAGYRQNGAFVMNRKTQSAIRKFKDTTGQLSLAAAGDRGRPRLTDDLPGLRGRGHAGYRGEFAGDRLRRLQPRLLGGRPRRRHRAARSLYGEALRAVLHHQARGRRRAGLRRHRADEVRGELMTKCPSFEAVGAPFFFVRISHARTGEPVRRNGIDLRGDVDKRRRHLHVGLEHCQVGGIADTGAELLDGLVHRIDVRHGHHAAAVSEGRGGSESRDACRRNGGHRCADAAIGQRDLIDALRHVNTGEARAARHTG